MASTSSSSISVASVPRYDVFLSFRGEDTRDSFTNNLYEALVLAGLRTFRDNDEIRRGQELKPELEGAIRESRASIILMSEKYANSRWCLDELVLILEQRRKFSHFVLPVLYHVDPSDVRNQRNSFAIEGTKWSEYNVNRWKAALTQVANLTGMCTLFCYSRLSNFVFDINFLYSSNKVCVTSAKYEHVIIWPETKFIAEIVDKISSELARKLVSIPNHLTGIETRAKGVNLWLKDKHSSSEVVAICGMGGSGKTTLARYIYHLNKQNFESSSFLEEIGKHYQQPLGLLGLQKQLLEDLLGGRNERISNVSEGTSKIEDALQLKKVLIVLDDINEHDELAALLGTKKFHTQSKIIITTRILDIYAWCRSISWKCRVLTLQLLNDDESLELLSCHAFGSKIPIEGFEELVVQIARYCEGNPLALKVLGSSLFVTPDGVPNSMIKIWRSTLNSLNSIEGDLDSKIRNVLQKSFHSLPRDIHKKLFLHIAIFFVGEYEDHVVRILERDWHAQAGIETLINRCLLTVSSEKKVMMHQLLQEMGRKIVLEESNDPEQRSRVWHDDESYQLLQKGDGSKTIEGLALDMLTIKKGKKSLAFKTSSLVKMDQLKLLQLNYVKLNGSYKNFPELIWLCWHGSYLKTVPSGLITSSLVAIDMSYGSFKVFELPMVLNSLKILKLKECHHLHSIRNLNYLPNLETLILRACFNLTHVCKTIRGIESLAELDLSGCNLVSEASWNKKGSCIGAGTREMPLFSLPRSLKTLYMDYCDIKCNNDVRMAFNAQSLHYMSLEGNSFEFLPSNMNFEMLRVLDLTFCRNLKSLLCLPSTLKELGTSHCTSLEKITFQSHRFKLQNFVYDHCSKLSEIEGLFKLVPVSKLDEAELGHMKWIKAYQDHEVYLIGDYITEGRIWQIQMLYEYGIRSIYLPGIMDQSMASAYMSSSSFLCFHVPLCPEKRMIQGLNVTILYRSLCEDEVAGNIFAIISNSTKSLIWKYNPLIRCKPKVDEDTVWISFLPIGDTLDAGDEVNVSILVGERFIISGCGASLVYSHTDCEIEQENNTNKEEIIGGDLSEFKLATGEYFLCRFRHVNPVLFKAAFGDSIHSTDLQGWIKYRHANFLSFRERKTSKDTLLKDIWLGGFNSEIEILEIKRVVSRLVGVKFVSYYSRTKKLLVAGHVDPIEVMQRVWEYDRMATILNMDYNTGCLKLHHKKLISFYLALSFLIIVLAWFAYNIHKYFLIH